MSERELMFTKESTNGNGVGRCLAFPALFSAERGRGELQCRVRVLKATLAVGSNGD